VTASVLRGPHGQAPGPLSALEARRVLVGTAPWMVERRGTRWLLSGYWAIRDPGVIAASQWKAAAERPGPWGRPTAPMLHRLLRAAAAPRVALARVELCGRPAFIQAAGWAEWRAVYQAPGRVHIAADASYAAAFEALQPGSWEAKGPTSTSPLVRVDPAGRLAGVLLPVHVAVSAWAAA
jgi:hypothetical protein